MPLLAQDVAWKPQHDTIVASNIPAALSANTPGPSTPLLQWFSTGRACNPASLVQYVTFVAIYHIGVAKGCTQTAAGGQPARKG